MQNGVQNKGFKWNKTQYKTYHAEKLYTVQTKVLKYSAASATVIFIITLLVCVDNFKIKHMCCTRES